jgi:DNA-binding transcriptional ArsR family regulator
MDQLETSLKKRTERLKYYSTVIVEFLHETCQQQIKDKFIDMSYVLVQVSLFSEIGVSKTELTNILNLSPATVIKYLKIFRDKELLIEEKDGREKLYRVDTDKLDSISLKVEDSDVEI